MQSGVIAYRILSPIQTELFRKPGDSVKATKTCFPFSLGGVRGNSRGTTEGMFLKFGLIWLMRVGRGGNQQAWMRGMGGGDGREEVSWDGSLGDTWDRKDIRSGCEMGKEY